MTNELKIKLNARLCAHEGSQEQTWGLRWPDTYNIDLMVLVLFGRLIVGKPLDPLDPGTRHAIAVTPLLAWVGLGPDGLSSSCYGPEEAFLALGQHTPLALFLAITTAATVFIIALGYNQVIELFPTGGGGYRVATALLGPRPGLVSGPALLVDNVLTVATLLASGVDAFFSLLPVGAQTIKLTTEAVLIVLMLTRRLATLTEEGLLEKRRYSEHPPREEYLLTVAGRDFLPVLFMIGAWGRQYRGDGKLVRFLDAETGTETRPVAVDEVTGARIGTRPIRVVEQGKD